VTTLQLILTHVREIANDFLRRFARNYRNGNGQRNCFIRLKRERERERSGKVVKNTTTFRVRKKESIYPV
jgi:hypothetical protein